MSQDKTKRKEIERLRAESDRWLLSPDEMQNVIDQLRVETDRCYDESVRLLKRAEQLSALADDTNYAASDWWMDVYPLRVEAYNAAAAGYSMRARAYEHANEAMMLSQKLKLLSECENTRKEDTK